MVLYHAEQQKILIINNVAVQRDNFNAHFRVITFT